MSPQTPTPVVGVVALALLVVVALALAGPAPRIMATRRGFRRAPGAALAVWQAVSTAAVLAALLVAPVTFHLVAGSGEPVADHGVALTVAVVVSGAVLVLLLLSGHRVGTRLRADRRRHRELVDVLATVTTHDGNEVRVLEHPTPTAYCLPGLRHRVVLTRGTMDLLSPPELAAVLAHEQAHLRSRHDLVLEFFLVVHDTVPARLRSTEALREVRLLVEVLADRAAVRAVGDALPLARALVTLAGSSHPDASLGGGSPAAIARLRIDLLDDRAPRPTVVAMLAFAAALLAAPPVLAVLAWTA